MKGGEEMSLKPVRQYSSVCFAHLLQYWDIGREDTKEQRTGDGSGGKENTFFEYWDAPWFWPLDWDTPLMSMPDLAPSSTYRPLVGKSESPKYIQTIQTPKNGPLQCR